jgi:hypothetical protein
MSYMIAAALNPLQVADSRTFPGSGLCFYGTVMILR